MIKARKNLVNEDDKMADRRVVFRGYGILCAAEKNPEKPSPFDPESITIWAGPRTILG